MPSSRVPAQNMPSLISLPYTLGLLQVSSSRIGITPDRNSLAGAEASSSIELITNKPLDRVPNQYSLDLPDWIEPQPEMVQFIPGKYIAFFCGRHTGWM